MSKKRNIGMTSLLVGDLAADGGPAIVLESLGRTYRETASITQEDNQTEDFLVEEEDDPIESIVTQKGATKIVWDVVDFDPEVMQKVWGGEIVDDQWNEPDEMPEVEKTVRLIPKIGEMFTYPRCKLSAVLVYNATRTDIARIRVTAKKLKPAKAGVSAFIYGNPPA
ncbi:hypothetical protein FACS1894177_07830 [Bacteroidia bacterium]|nr:hypothetical protein FACS1894177_07830 [Bacteroidia bacterium]